MLKEALEWLKGELIDPVSVLENPNGDGQIIVAPDNYGQRDIPGPTRTRRSHSFTNIDSFSAWIHRFAMGATVETLFDESRDVAVSIIDAAEDTGFDSATLRLVRHPAFQNLTGVLGREMPQREIVLSVRRFSDYLANQTVLSELRRFAVKQGGEANVELDPRGVYTFRGESRTQTVEGEIPAEFDVVMPVFRGVESPLTPQGEAQYVIGIQLTIRETDQGPMFTLDCPALDLVLYQARLDAVAHLTRVLGEDFPVGLGSICTSDVPMFDREIRGIRIDPKIEIPEAENKSK